VVATPWPSSWEPTTRGSLRNTEFGSVSERVLDRRRRVVGFCVRHHFRPYPMGIQRLRHDRLAHRYSLCRPLPGRLISTVSYVTPAARFCCGCRAGPRYSRCSTLSMPLRHSASIRPTCRRIIGRTTVGENPRPTHASVGGHGCLGGGSRRVAFRGDHRRQAARRRNAGGSVNLRSSRIHATYRSSRY
jgi:hypothetical protein